MPPLWPQSRFPAKTPEHCCVPKLPLRSPIRCSGSGLAQDTPPALAPARSLACLPSAGAEGVEVVRADKADNVPAVMRDVPVAAEDAVGDKADTHSAEASRIHAGQVYCSDSIHSQHLVQAAARTQ